MITLAVFFASIELMDDPTLSKLTSACQDLKKIVHTSFRVETSLDEIDKKLFQMHESLSMASKKVAPFQTLSIVNKALDTRINRAISPALSLLESFKLSESLQRKLLHLAGKLCNEKVHEKRLRRLVKYVDCVDQLNGAINSIGQECEPAIQKLQEVVEFLSRTKATDLGRTQRLREALITLKALYETEVDAMKFDGLLDEGLLNLQDEFESLLLSLRHENIGDGVDEDEMREVLPTELGTQLEVEVLGRISGALAANDCVDICIDIYVKARYRRAAKALMRLNPDYLRTFNPEEIDEMEWENLETSISLWINHFELAVKSVLVSEKILCQQVLGTVLDGVTVWPECFTKISDKIMAVFFRFSEGVARSNKEPQKLFKLLDMFDSLETLKPKFLETFEGEAGADICSRFRELEKLLVHASTRVFWEFGLRIEANQDGSGQDASVPKLVRYAINYLECLASESYSKSMARVFRIEQSWKAGMFSNTETDEDLLRDAVSNVMEAIQRNIEAKKARFRDKSLCSIFVMNAFWYVYMRTKGTELGKLLGEQYLKKQYKIIAEESAYFYQKQAWGGLVKLLDIEEQNTELVARGKMEAFKKELNDNLQKYGSSYYYIPDGDLREQIREATVRFVVPAYEEFLSAYSSVLQTRASFLSPRSLEDMLVQVFDGGNLQKGYGKSSSLGRLRREQRDSTDSRSVGKSHRRANSSVET